MVKTEYKIDRGVAIPKDKLHPNPWNPNHMNPRQQKGVEESVTTYGQVMELLVRPHPDIEGEYQIIDGEHRFKALPNEVYCNVIHGLPDAEAKKLTIVMNETRGSADKIELAQLLAEIDSEVEDLANALPYEDSELEELIKLADVDWDSFTDEFDEDGEDADSSASENTGDWKHLNVKMTPEAFDCLQQATDLIKDNQDLDKDPAVAWGQVLEVLASEYIGR